MSEEKTQSILYISIENWGKYNSRPDRKNFIWFRLENNFFDDPEVYSLSNLGKLIYVFLLCCRSKTDKNVFKINTKKLGFELSLSELEIMNKLDELESFSFIRVLKTPNDGIKTPKDGLQTDRQTDRQTARGAEEDFNFNKGTEVLSLVNIWNEHCGVLPKVSKVSLRRKTQIKQRLKEESDLEYWKQVVQKIEESNFCQGKNERGWRADFDFFLKPGTHISAMEGKYDNRQKQNSNGEKLEPKYKQKPNESDEEFSKRILQTRIRLIEESKEKLSLEEI